MKRRIPQSGDEWFRRAVRYLARFDRTAAQVERFLVSKGASSGQIKQVLSRLFALRYLDDRAYAARWMEATLARRPMGRERLKNELVARGCREALAEQVIGEGLQGMDEESLARRALKLKSRALKPVPLQRAVSLLRQRGFGEDTIARIISDSPQAKERA